MKDYAVAYKISESFDGFIVTGLCKVINRYMDLYRILNILNVKWIRTTKSESNYNELLSCTCKYVLHIGKLCDDI